MSYPNKEKHRQHKLVKDEKYSTKERVEKMLQKKTGNVPEEKRKELLDKLREEFGPFYGEKKERKEK